MPSVSKEDYLKAIYHLHVSDSAGVSTKAIADHLNITASSSTDMIKKLAADKLITYRPYKGVQLTAEGKAIAVDIVRKHRLWETFLVEKLDFRWDEVHEVAEQLEHIKSQQLINRLDAFLGYPKSDPHGDPIPDEDGKMRARYEKRLSALKESDTATVVGVQDHSREFLLFLEERQIVLGTEIQVRKVFTYDQSMLIASGSGEQILSAAICRNLVVTLS